MRCFAACALGVVVASTTAASAVPEIDPCLNATATCLSHAGKVIGDITCGWCPLSDKCVENAKSTKDPDPSWCLESWLADQNDGVPPLYQSGGGKNDTVYGWEFYYKRCKSGPMVTDPAKCAPVPPAPTPAKAVAPVTGTGNAPAPTPGKFVMNITMYDNMPAGDKTPAGFWATVCYVNSVDDCWLFPNNPGNPGATGPKAIEGTFDPKTKTYDAWVEVPDTWKYLDFTKVKVADKYHQATHKVNPGNRFHPAPYPLCLCNGPIGLYCGMHTCQKARGDPTDGGCCLNSAQTEEEWLAERAAEAEQEQVVKIESA